MRVMLDLINEQLPLPLMLAFCIRIVVAGVCGAAIGYERSLRFKESGVRTHCIVGLSAALMMVISKYAFVDMGSGSNLFPGTRGADTARIAAQVISGVSFLGAGVIFKEGKSVHGLTTSAVIWVTAGVGLAIGAGLYLIGLFVTVFVVLVMVVMHRITVGGDAFISGYLKITVSDGLAFQEHLSEMFQELHVTVMQNTVVKREGATDFELEIKIPVKSDGYQKIVRFLSEDRSVKAFNASQERE